MPRERKRTTERGVPIDILESASEFVLKEGASVRGVARDFGICHTTLYRFCKKKNALQTENNTQVLTSGYWSSKKVFTNGQEEIIANYLKRVSELYLGVTHKEVRRLAFQVANLYQRKFPSTWEEKGMAGRDWFLTFIKKNPSICIKRMPRTKRSDKVPNTDGIEDNKSDNELVREIPVNEIKNATKEETTTINDDKCPKTEIMDQNII